MRADMPDTDTGAAGTQRRALPLTARAPSFVGRDAEVAALQQLVQHARGGRGGLAVVEGDAGIGKSRLLAEILVSAERHDVTALVGHGSELESDRPFGPLVEALDLRSDTTDPARRALAALLDGGAHASVSDWESPSPELRYRIVEGMVALVEQLAASGPLALAIDDLQWADPSTLLVLARLARACAQLPIAVLATCRPHPRSAALDGLLDELDAAGAVRIGLGRLDHGAVTDLVTDLLGATPQPGLLARVERADGNPLFCVELVDALVDDEAITVVDGTADVDGSADAGGVLPGAVRRLVVGRLLRLCEDSRDLLRTASVLGSVFSLDDLAVVLDAPASDLLVGLADPLRTGLIREAGERLAFRHALVRDALYEDLPHAGRMALHCQAARRLAAAGRQPAQVARHFLLGASPGDEQAIAWLRRAGQEAAARAPQVAVELFDAALRLGAGAAEDRDTLHAERGIALMWAGRLADGEAALRALLERPHDPGVDARARLALAQTLILQARTADAVALLEHAHERPGVADGDRARMLGTAAITRLVTVDLAGADHDAATARTLGRACGDDAAVCLGLWVQAALTGLRGHTADAIATIEQAVAIATASTEREASRIPPQFLLGDLQVDADELDDCVKTVQTARGVSEELGAVWDVPVAHLLAGCAHFHAGDYDDALAEVQAGMEVGREVGSRLLGAWAHAIVAHVRLQRGDLSGAWESVQAGEQEITVTGAQLRGTDWLLWTRALLSEAEGDAATARAILAAVWDAHSQLGILKERRLLGPDLVRLHLAADDATAARRVTDDVVEAAEANGSVGARGAALRCRGLADEDADLLVRAMQHSRAGPRRLEHAGTCEDAGVVLGRDGRREEAVAALDEALAIYLEVDAARPAARAQAALRDLGVRRGRRGPRARPATGWDALTDTEAQVTALVAEGLTNPQVGARLFISRRTVETHLSHVFAKLGVSSRVELAGFVAARRG